MVNEQLNCTRMVEERAIAGAKALSDWLRRCRPAVEELRGETFKKLLKILVDSVLLYGPEVWDSCEKLAPYNKYVQTKLGIIYIGSQRATERPQKVAQSRHLSSFWYDDIC